MGDFFEAVKRNERNFAKMEVRFGDDLDAICAYYRKKAKRLLAKHNNNVADFDAAEASGVGVDEARVKCEKSNQRYGDSRHEQEIYLARKWRRDNPLGGGIFPGFGRLARAAKVGTDAAAWARIWEADVMRWISKKLECAEADLVKAIAEMHKIIWDFRAPWSERAVPALYGDRNLCL